MKWIQIAKAFTMATVVALVLRLFLIEDYRISSDSMMPNLFRGDLILVSKSAFNLRFPFSSFELARTGKPQRSQVVAFSVPDHGVDTYIKRIVAIGGDKVEIKNGALWVNDQKADYLPTNAEEQNHLIQEKWSSGVSYPVLAPPDTMKDYGPVDIPADHFFALGDNRLESLDSRSWGPIPYSCLKGKVSIVWLSVGPAGSIRPNRWLSAVP